MQAASQTKEKTEWESISDSDVQSQYQSVCDVWKDCVHRFVTKVEFQTPIYIEAYSQVHSEFLHSIDNLFGTCYIWQKQYFDRLGIDQNITASYGKLCESIMDNTTEMMDMYANYKKIQADTMVTAMKTANNYMHLWIDMFGKSVSFWNRYWSGFKGS